MIPLSWIHWQNDDEHNIAAEKNLRAKSTKQQNPKLSTQKTFLSHSFHLPSFNLSLEQNLDWHASEASYTQCLKITEKVSFNIP